MAYTKSEYEKILISSIPVIKDMNIKITTLEVGNILLQAPLKSNFNYEGTAFGGSLNTITVVLF